MEPDRLLLIVGNDAAFARTLSRSFERRGYAVLLAVNLEEVSKVLQTHTPNYAVVDLKLSGGASGLACVQTLHAHDPHTLIVVPTVTRASRLPSRRSSSGSAITRSARNRQARARDFETDRTRAGVPASEAEGVRVQYHTNRMT